MRMKLFRVVSREVSGVLAARVRGAFPPPVFMSLKGSFKAVFSQRFRAVIRLCSRGFRGRFQGSPVGHFGDARAANAGTLF
jgi:hypothetical protein